jgi:guanylate kinase
MEVTLRLREQFIDVLKDYTPSQNTLRTLADMPLIILLGVSGSGRNTIIDELVATGRYYYIVSDTTRPPKVRNGRLEEDGVIYNFRTEEAILEDLKKGLYLEAELIHDQQVSGNSVHEIRKAHESGKVPINEVDLGGTDAIATAKPDTIFMFVVPPSFDEWMKRLHAREVMGEDELHNRIRTAIRILQIVLSSERFVFVVNDKLAQVVSTVDDYGSGEHHDLHNEEARQITQKLLDDIIINYPTLA